MGREVVRQFGEVAYSFKNCSEAAEATAIWYNYDGDEVAFEESLNAADISFKYTNVRVGEPDWVRR